MSACPSEEDFVGLLEGTLPEAQAAELHTHVDGCGSCQTLLAALGRAAPPTVGADMPILDPANYHLDGQIAMGGLGRVLRARDRRLGRVVAIKQLLVDNPGAEARFRREALVTAWLQHPAIVPVYEAGRWPNGEAFYAMKLVAGRSLDEVIADAPTLDGRMALLPNLIAVAEAIAYAHGEGVIHRDLKPANILVGSFGETVVIDWGLAKVVGDAARAPLADDQADAQLSVDGMVVGTPAYMAPEQARGADVDARADVYALGAVLYQLLVGAAPFRGPAHEVLRRVQTESPPPVDELQRGVARELKAIVEKAMARDPAARYPSAKELAAELRRFITGQLVRAHHYSRLRLFARWLRKHQLATVTLGLVAVLGSLSVTRIVRERNRAEAARAVAESRQRELMLAQARSALEADPTTAVAWLKSYVEVGGDPARAWPIAADAAGRGVARVVFATTTTTLSSDGAMVAAVDPVSRRLAVWRTADGSHRTLGGDDDQFDKEVDLSFSPDGRWLATLAGEAQLWDLTTGKPRTLQGVGDAHMIEFRPDSRQLMLQDFERVTVVDIDGGATRTMPLRCRFGVGCTWPTVYYAPDGRLRQLEEDQTSVRIGGFEGPVEHRLTLEKRSIVAVARAKDDQHLAMAGKRVRFWDLASGAVRTAPVGADDRVDLSPDGRRVTFVDEHGAIAVWTPDTNEVQSIANDGVEVTQVAFTARGDLVSVGRDHTLRVWDAASFPRLTIRGRQDPDIEISDDGSALLTSGDDETRLWSIAALPRVVGRTATGIRELQLADDGRTLAATAVNDSQVHLLPADSGRPELLDPEAEQPRAMSLAPDGQLLATVASGDVRLCPLPRGACRTLHVPAAANHVVFAPDGKSLAVSSSDGMVRLYDRQGHLERELRGQEQDALRAVFSAAGDRLAVIGLDPTLRVLDLTNGSTQAIAAHAATQLVFSPDGRRLATGAPDGVVRVFTLASGTSKSLAITRSAITLVAFSPDGHSIAALGGDRTVTLWQPESGRVRTLEGHDEMLLDLAFSPDGKLLATASDDRTVRLWAAGSAHVVALFRGHTGPVRTVRFARDGRYVYSGSDDGTVRQWPVDAADGDDGRALSRWLDRLTTVSLGDDGRVRSR